MPIIHNGVDVTNTENILTNKWKSETVYGDREAEEQGYCIFNNCVKAIELIKKHIDNNSRVAFHTDVDVDGVGTTYILVKALSYLGIHNTPLIINQEKIHGIQQKHADYLNSHDIADLIIISDSSCNELDIIKQFNCDVLVIDHHDMTHNDTYGLCNDGLHSYVIVNNTIANSNQDVDNLSLRNYNSKAFEKVEKFDGEQAMSCGLVVYELLRVYCTCFADERILTNLRLYQWVGITLFTDVIDTLNERNQWYLNKTVFNREIENTLGIILNRLSKFKGQIDKSYIQYSLAPLINKTIRAGKSAIALDKIVNNPGSIGELRVYGDIQQDVIDKVMYFEDNNGTKAKRTFEDATITLNTSKLGIHPNYNGVIASRIAGDLCKNTAVFYENEQGLCKGSFRGKYKNVNYRLFFANYADDIYAQGHPGAFGFELTKEQLKSIMDSISTIEAERDNRPFITAGNMTPEEYGVYHITDINEFKRLGYVWKIAIGNAKVSSIDEIFIRVKASELSLKSTKGKLFIYDVLGIECKAFEAMKGEYFDIYFEYTNEITAYIRNVKG